MTSTTTLSLRLLSERKRLDINQTDMARAGGVAMTTYGNYEAGKRVPDATCLMQWRTAGVDVLYLLTGQRNNTALTNVETVLLEQFNRLDPKMQRATLSMMQTYNSEG